MQPNPYNSEFYSAVTETSLRSAGIVIPLLIGLFHPESVIDVGCGTGSWLKEFKTNGVRSVLGVDSVNVPESQLLIDSTEFIRTDLTKPLALNQTFDIALSLEVAEHLPKEAAKDFVTSLTRLAPVVIFSAAHTGQGGTDHINEQMPGYWKRLFAQYGYQRLDIIRPLIWKDERVALWFRTNLFVFVSPTMTSPHISQRDRLGAKMFALRKFLRGWARVNVRPLLFRK